MKCVGCWHQGIYSINYSNILSKLIYYAGRYCESFSSDLFLIWKCYVELCLENKNYKGSTIVFGFRENGVDTQDEIKIKKEKYGYEDYYYRKICTLEITIKDDVITMELKGE